MCLLSVVCLNCVCVCVCSCLCFCLLWRFDVLFCMFCMLYYAFYMFIDVVLSACICCMSFTDFQHMLYLFCAVAFFCTCCICFCVLLVFLMDSYVLIWFVPLRSLSIEQLNQLKDLLSFASAVLRPLQSWRSTSAILPLVDIVWTCATLIIIA